MEFDIKLTADAKKKIDGLARAGKVDLRPVMVPIGAGYRKEVKAIFGKKQPRGEGEQWAPLSDKYKKWKDRKFPGKPLLVRTGLLKDSITQQSAQGNITVISKIGAVFGTSVRYGIYHDEGRGRNPKRNFSEPSERRKQIWVDQIERAVRHNFEVNGISVSGEIIKG